MAKSFSYFCNEWFGHFLALDMCLHVVLCFFYKLKHIVVVYIKSKHHVYVVHFHLHVLNAIGYLHLSMSSRVICERKYSLVYMPLQTFRKIASYFVGTIYKPTTGTSGNGT